MPTQYLKFLIFTMARFNIFAINIAFQCRITRLVRNNVVSQYPALGDSSNSGLPPRPWVEGSAPSLLDIFVTVVEHLIKPL
jgi:hypothetical protein